MKEKNQRGGERLISACNIIGGGIFAVKYFRQSHAAALFFKLITHDN